MSEAGVLLKLPTVNGNTEEWPFFKAKIKAFMVRQKLMKILTWKKDIPKSLISVRVSEP
jgi:hypothetical protein